MERERLLQDSGICITLWQRRRQQNSIYCYANRKPGHFWKGSRLATGRTRHLSFDKMATAKCPPMTISVCYTRKQIRNKTAKGTMLPPISCGKVWRFVCKLAIYTKTAITIPIAAQIYSLK